MTGKLNNAHSSTVINLQNMPTHAVSTQALSDVRVKRSITIYDKLLCKKKSPLTVSDDQLPVSGKWEM